jgi:hypothetical protein
MKLHDIADPLTDDQRDALPFLIVRFQAYDWRPTPDGTIEYTLKTAPGRITPPTTYTLTYADTKSYARKARQWVADGARPERAARF